MSSLSNEQRKQGKRTGELTAENPEHSSSLAHFQLVSWTDHSQLSNVSKWFQVEDSKVLPNYMLQSPT